MDSADRDTRRHGIEQLPHFRRSADEAEICGQRIGGSQRNHAQRNIGPHQTLQQRMYRAIAAAGNNGVAAIADSLSRLGRAPSDVLHT